MRFLVVTMSKHPFPPEAASGLLQAMKAWAEEHTRSGRMEHIWAFAGRPGGGGIVNVDSLEELDEVMVGFPFGPFSEIEIYPLTDLQSSLERFGRIMEQMGGPGSAP